MMNYCFTHGSTVKGGVRETFPINAHVLFTLAGHPDKTSRSYKSIINNVSLQITEYQGVRHIPFNEQEPHDVRIGFSLRASPNIVSDCYLFVIVFRLKKQ